MKNILPLLFGAALLPMAVQATSTSNVVGYTTQDLPAGVFTIVGQNLLSPALVSSTLDDVSGNPVLTDSATDFDALLTTQEGLVSGVDLVVLEVTSGTAIGTVQEFNTWSGNTITVPGAIPGLADDDKYALRIPPTLQEMFTDVVVGAIGAGTSDKVWVPQGDGTYVKYWYKNFLATQEWHTTTTGTDDTGLVTDDVPLIYVDGVLIQKTGTPGEIVLTGEVKTTGTNIMVAPGFNPASIVPPVGLTLGNSGLEASLTGAIGAGTSDKVWVQDGAGGYTKYWYKNFLATQEWHTTSTGTDDTGVVADPNLVDLEGAIYIQSVSAGNKVIKMNVPASYGSLNPNP